jgi:NAD(P)-dependent dehydrogenase (short-subunit alcohol dehydrogenase family)
VVENAQKAAQRMEKKVILITGATGGLGKAMTKHFEGRGYSLALHMHESAPFEVTGDHEWFSADLADIARLQQMMEQVTERFGKVDILINNAGISRNGMSWKLDSGDWNKVIAVNLTAPFELIKAVLPSMRKNGWGRIVSISSVVAQTGMPGTVAYAASKAGLLGITKTVAKETAGSGITVNALALGYFNQGMINDVSPDLQEQIREMIPKKRFGSPDTILDTIDWLLLPSSDYVTGQTISLNGGLHS